MSPTVFKSVEDSRKPDFISNRGLEEEVIERHFAEVTAGCNDVMLKQVFLKVKVTASFEANVTALKTVDSKFLVSALQFLAGETDHAEVAVNLVKDGLVFAVLAEIGRRLPFKCGTCAKPVINTHSSPLTSGCKQCGIGECSECCDKASGETKDSSWFFLCPPCVATVAEAKEIPNCFFKAKHRKVEVVTPSAPADSVSEDSDEEEEPASLPLGQRVRSRSPSIQVFPDLFPDLQSQSQSQTQPPVSGVPATPAQGGEEAGEAFAEPSARVRNKAKKARKETQVSNSSQSQAKGSCRHFLTGGCRHGFLGKTPRGTVRECPFPHPPTCKAYLNNGNMAGGCRKGGKCESLHPKMCQESLRTRTCSKAKGGVRCPQGYHLRGTKAVSTPVTALTAPKAPTAPKVPTAPKADPASSKRTVWPDPSPQPNLSPSPVDPRSSLASFLGEIIRLELKALLTTAAPPEALRPPVPAPVPAQATVNPLAALLALLSQ